MIALINRGANINQEAFIGVDHLNERAVNNFLQGTPLDWASFRLKYNEQRDMDIVNFMIEKGAIRKVKYSSDYAPPCPLIHEFLNNLSL